MLVIALAALVALPPGRASAFDGPGASARRAVVPGELVIGFEGSASAAEERRAVAEAGGRIDERLRLVDGAVVTAKDGTGTAELAEELDDAGAVSYVEPNYVLHAARLPNDPNFGVLWGLHNTGQLGGTPGADVNAPSAWDVLTGGPTTVAVIDSGVDYTHPDLAANMWTNPDDPANGSDDDGDGFVDDVHGADFLDDDSDPSDDAGHGTHLAGVIGALGDNGIGVAGVNWNVRLLAARFLNDAGEGNTADAAKAIDYALAKGARVINASWGSSSFSWTLYNAVKRAGDNGALFIAAAGNEGRNADAVPDYPAAFSLPNVISVTALDRHDRLPGYANYGAQSVDVGAPGDQIYSTVPPSVSASGYALFSGTSMAAPYVSGAAALYLSVFPSASTTQVKSVLLGSVDPVAALSGKSVSGGRLDVGKALGTQRPPVAASSPPPDTTPPSQFRLLHPRYRYASHRRALRFRWQSAKDTTGILYYKLYVDGRLRRTLHDPDGRAGRDPGTRARLRLRRGRHRWSVRAYDYAGNRRTASATRRPGRTSSVLYVGKHK
jgi:subtilisin family serine protease